MTIFSFFTEEGGFSRRSMIILIIASGLSGGFLLGVINTAAEMAADSEGKIRFFVLFVLTLAFFTITKRIALVHATRAGERAIREIRIRLADKIRHSELLFMERTGRGEIYARLTQDANSISQAVPMIFNGYQSIVLLLAGLLYIATVSWVACLLSFSFLALMSYAYVRNSRLIISDLKTATTKETEFFDALSNLVGGFKEIKINQRKNDGVQERVARIARETEGLLVRTGLRYITHLVASQTALYLLIGTIVFVLPTFDFANPERILKLTAAGLFIVAPLEVIFTAYFFHNKAIVALRNIEGLEARLDDALEKQEIGSSPNSINFGDFNTLSLEDVRFQYPNSEEGYAIGPLSITFERGTATFITGGNGSGKSTLLKVLTGLYPLSEGHIRINGKTVSKNDYPSFRQIFSAIFSDFHLFDRLYGLRYVDRSEVRRLLDEMELSDKTSFEDNAFTDLDLSTGQRKRLAMVIARLEDRPVYVFDEWAADQDPQFRRYFYEILIPRFKNEGKTLIVVTPDDAYFHHADQLIKLDYGQLARD
jgi:putative ATP-binding cassette transporter